MTRVLLAEDSPTQAREVQLILESEGFEVEIAVDGAAALRRARAAVFDLILSDVMMPGLTGYELCRAVKAAPETKGIPFVLLTSLADPMHVIEGLECGADNFLTKPYEPSYLLGRLKGLLESRRMRAERRPTAGVEVLFLGRTFTITSEKEQILDLLISTFEDTLRKNRELEESQAKVAATLAKLELAHQELESFSYSVSHDLRAPVRHIEGFTRALLEDHAAALDATGRDHLDRVNAAAQRMNALIDGLLRLARAARLEPRAREVAPAELARSVFADLQAAEPSRQVELVVGEVPRCLGDPDLLRAVFQNLIGNAWKFTSQVERPRIEVAGHSEGAQVQLEVRDNGAGFDMQGVDRLFAPFQRLHSEKEFAGTGIGLATVRRIVQRHGGRVWAESAPGAGACFRFTLPAATRGNGK